MKGKSIRRTKRKTLNSITVFTDGACSGNPGPSSVGVCVLDDEGNVLREVSETIGYATNNVAEYMACITGLIEALKIGFSVQSTAYSEQTGKRKQPPVPCPLPPVMLCADSELIIRQLQGVYSVKSVDLLPLHLVAKRLLGLFERVELKSIPREQNKRADALAKQALKQGTAGGEMSAGNHDEQKRYHLQQGELL